MKQNKKEAFNLRKQGKSYKEIQEILNLSKSTLSGWFQNEEWSKNIKRVNLEKNRKRTIEHIQKINTNRDIMLLKKYKEVEEEAEKDFEIYKNDPSFIAGLMVYAGEGDKVNKHLTRISNSDFYLHRIFIAFLEKFLDIKREKIKIGLILYPDNNIENCIEKWSEELNISKNNFYKTQIIIGKEKTKKLQYGIGMSIISKTVKKKKILKWLELCKVHF